MSRFVSAGTVNEEGSFSSSPKDTEWKKAQDEIDNNQTSKEQALNQDEGKSLYEVLQSNKAKKQEAFEESIRLKNQFRALDEDEVDFLDSVLESTRAKDANIKQETTEQLDSFRKKREDIEKATNGQEQEGQEEDELHWASSGRKRKKHRANESFPQLKKRKSSAGNDQKPPSRSSLSVAHPSSGAAEERDSTNGEGLSNSRSTASLDDSSAPEVEVGQSTSTTRYSNTEPAENSASTAPKSVGLGLGAYSSDED